MNARKEIQMGLRRLQSKFSRFYSTVLTEKNMTIPQFSLLILVVDDGALRMCDLAERLHIANASVTNLADRLEAQKLIRRQPDPDDRRAYRIEATEKGEKLVAETRKMTVDQVSKRLDDFTDEEIIIVKKFHGVMESTLDGLLEKLKAVPK